MVLLGLYLERTAPSANYCCVTFYRRRLPHLYEVGWPIFIAWRLSGSLPLGRGPFHLRQPSIADMVVEAIQYNANTLGHYALHAFVIMSNHVHILATPTIPLPKLTKSLKGITAKRANEILGLTGAPFWQEESYDHLVRNERAFRSIRNYIENNPVRAGLVRDAKDYRWSSAGWAD